MARLILAVCRTNQDRNPVAGGGNEMQHIAPLASAILTAAARFGIVAKAFDPQPESSDRPVGSLQGLIAQQRAAAAWIGETTQPGDLTVSLNLHSDSTDPRNPQRHCGYYGPFAALPLSEWLGRALTDSIKSWFGGKVYNADYGSYVFARTFLPDGRPPIACPVLLEVGTHMDPDDVAAVRDHPEEIAHQVVSTLAGFFGLVTTLNTSELRVYPAWAMARLDNGQDPRIREEFVKLLQDLGCDPSDLFRWGWPA